MLLDIFKIKSNGKKQKKKVYIWYIISNRITCITLYNNLVLDYFHDWYFFDFGKSLHTELTHHLIQYIKYTQCALYIESLRCICL